MIFKNQIRFKHGSLKRGERCLYKNHEGVYLGSFKECDSGKFVHMIKLGVCALADAPIYEDVIIECTDLNDITCIKQQAPAIDGQMQLC